MTEQNWRNDGHCAGAPLGVFFHPDGERDPDRSRREARAKSYCTGCPVVGECLHEALTLPNSYGTWGGMSERERRKVDSEEYARLVEGGYRPAVAAAIAARPPAARPAPTEMVVEVPCAS